MRPVVIIGDMLEILENEQELCLARAWFITALIANTQPVGNLVVTYLRNSRAYVVG
jgi:hypothetical protein